MRFFTLFIIVFYASQVIGVNYNKNCEIRAILQHLITNSYHPKTTKLPYSELKLRKTFGGIKQNKLNHIIAENNGYRVFNIVARFISPSSCH